MKKNVRKIALLLVVILLLSVAWILFYPQFRSASGITIESLTQEEVATIQNDLDFFLPDNVKIVLVYYRSLLQDSSFDMVFCIPEDDETKWVDSILNGYEVHSIGSFGVADNTITVGGITYEPVASFGSTNRSFTNIFQYQNIEGYTWFKLFWDSPSNEIISFFYKKIYAFAPWLN